MSTFLGHIDEIPNISVDYFGPENRKTSQWFFLSHCHTDHMRELQTSLPGPLYATEITAIFLKKKFSFATDIQILEMNTPTIVINTEDFKLIATALPAQHCPGSAMFLFETQDTTVLYTGDFRLRKSDFQKLSVLAEKCIDAVYLDTTFMYERYKFFPAPLDSINEICRLCQEWIRLGESHRIIIENAANYGSEYLFMELGRKLKCKIYVDPGQWEQYVYIPAMDQHISKNPDECQIYTRLKRYSFDFSLSEFKCRTVLPSAYFWTNWRPGSPIALKEGKDTFRVAISYHSSLSEIRDFLKFVRPARVKVNVNPSSDNDKRELTSNISEILADIGSCDVGIRDGRIFKFSTIFSLIKEHTPEGDSKEDAKVCVLPKRARF